MSHHAPSLAHIGSSGSLVLDSNKREGLRSLLACVYPSVAQLERRGERRYPYPYLVRLAPLADDGRTRLDEHIVVVGKQISEHGLGFYHQQPLAFRQAIVSLDRADGPAIQVQIDLTWCRFTRLGWYESGGRFLQVISSDDSDSG